MQKPWGLTLLTISLCFCAFGSGATTPPAKRAHIISYVPHSAVETVYKPIIQQAYQELGIPVRFEAVPDDRSLRLLEQGRTDADVVRIETVLAGYKNIVAVEPALGNVDFVLYCQLELPCQADALRPGLTIGLVGAESYFTRLLEQSEARVLRLQSYHQMQQLFDAGRLHYAVNVIDRQSAQNHLFQRPHNETKLFSVHGFHLVHQRHADLAQRLAPIIRRLLTERIANTAQVSP